MHGGKSPVGIASGTFQSGRYSRYLPTRLLDRYHEAGADPDLLVLREDIALLDARLADLLGRVDTGESGARWQQVKAAWKAWQKSRGTEQEAGVLADLQASIFAGVSDMEAWAEIHEGLIRREKLVASERKRLVEMQQVLSATEAMVLLAQVADTVRRHVSDRVALANISADLARLVAVRSGDDAGAGRAG